MYPQSTGQYHLYIMVFIGYIIFQIDIHFRNSASLLRVFNPKSASNTKEIYCQFKTFMSFVTLPKLSESKDNLVLDN